MNGVQCLSPIFRHLSLYNSMDCSASEMIPSNTGNNGRIDLQNYRNSQLIAGIQRDAPAHSQHMVPDHDSFEATMDYCNALATRSPAIPEGYPGSFYAIYTGQIN